MSDLENKVAQHEVKLGHLEKISDQTLESVKELVGGITELTTEVKLLVATHRNVEKSNQRLWERHEALTARVEHLEDFKLENAAVLLGLHTLNRKIITIIVVALAGLVIGPPATMTYFMNNTAPQQSSEVKQHGEVTEKAPRDPKQQSGQP